MKKHKTKSQKRIFFKARDYTINCKETYSNARAKLIRIPILLFLMVLSLYVSAQELSITGTVTDDTGNAMPGVTVFLKGTTQGTTTDVDGKYTISGVSIGSTIIYSFIGMTTQEVVVANESNIDITLKAEYLGLDEVMIIGYSSVERKKVLGSIASVNSEEMTQATPVAAFDAIQGKVAGVQILSNGGPGSGFDINLSSIKKELVEKLFLHHIL